MKKLFEKFNLKGKISIVVGGSGQIGFETVSTLLKSGSIVINADCFNRRKKTRNYFFYEVNVDNEDEVIELKKKFSEPNLTTICDDMNSAIKKSLELKNVERVVIFGSFYTIADATLIVDKM